MFYSATKFDDTANGEGIRHSIWVSGCRNHCKGCFNPETWNFAYGKKYTRDVGKELVEAAKKPYINGITILGGEPFEEENQPEVADLIKMFRDTFGHDKTVWVFSGYRITDLIDGGRKHISFTTDYILENIDVLVEGPFIEELKDLSLQFRGSSNQRIMTHEDIMVPRLPVKEHYDFIDNLMFSG